MARGAPEAKRQSIVVRASLPDDERARTASLAAYAFRGGRLLDVKPLEANGEATLSVPQGAEPSGVRVVVGPREEGEKATLAELARRGAVQQQVRLELKGPQVVVETAIDLQQILCWILGRCSVRGTVLKRTALDGENVDLPVCHATVEVYEVDPFILLLPKLPKSAIDRLRDFILHPVPLPHPIPDPLPGPFPGPFPAAPEPFLSSRTAMVPKSFAAEFSAGSGALQATSSAACCGGGTVEPELLSGPLESATTLKLAARVGSDMAFQQALIAHELLVRPIFCLLFPKYFHMQLVATTTTDHCGHFSAVFWRGCNNPDVPDLYFKVRQRFLWLDIPIYAPTPVPCYTWWNYKCGTEVTLVTHHPLARTCGSCPDVVAGENWVLFVAIGQTSLNAIYGDSSALQGATTTTNRGLTSSGAPFGGILRPELLFDPSLRDTLGVKYYRLFWRRQGDPGWIQMLGDVNRHYTYEVGGEPVGTLYPVGPLSPPDAPQANLYEIPPSLPPHGVWGPVIAPTDYQNGIFDTRLPAPGITYDANGAEVGSDHSGKFEIRLELFDAAGGPVDIAALGIRYFVPDVDDLTGTITTHDAAPLGLVDGNAMVVTVHVDNNPTYAEIDAPVNGAASADACCGVLGFHPNDSVTLPWRAKHRNGFASFQFQTKRVDQLVFSQPETPVGLVGNFSTTQSAQGLMDANLPPGCAAGGCNVAAFASWEYVTAMATDGWSRLTYLDSWDFEAFTLKKGG